MPRAVLCLDCGRPTQHAPKGRCTDCQKAKDDADPYQRPEWRRKAKQARERHRECAICGSTERLITHHKWARKDGGPDQADNFILLCGAGAINMPWRSCHNQYEADVRGYRDTKLRRLVEAL